MNIKKTMNKLRLKIALFFLTTEEKTLIFNSIFYTAMNKPNERYNQFYL